MPPAPPVKNVPTYLTVDEVYRWANVDGSAKILHHEVKPDYLYTHIEARRPYGVGIAGTYAGGLAGPAPADTAVLGAFGAAYSWEDALVANFPGVFAYAECYVALRFLVQEFSPAGAFVKSSLGPDTVVYDGHAYPGGMDWQHRRNWYHPILDFHSQPDHTYRIRLEAYHFVRAGGLGKLVVAGAGMAFELEPIRYVFLEVS
jgi:hypothetical protein